jgi:prepilin-type N-terminal cleavage/methylation domain-containing protein
MTVNRHKSVKAFTLIELMVAMVILIIGVTGAMGYRYHSALNARKADVQITAARIGLSLLQNWKGYGGYSGYSTYDLDDGTDLWDPNDYDPNYDYDTYNPDDYNYDLNDANGAVFLGPELTIYNSAPGPDVPSGFTALDSSSNPNFRIVDDGVNYYATLSYKDEVGEPRVLNVCVAWRGDYQTWTDSNPYQSVTLTTYADD